MYAVIKRITLLNLFLSLVVLSTYAQQSPTKRLNVLLIVADDMGMQMSALNTPGVKTPAIDGLIENGVLLKRAYAVYPSCSPSRTSFLTGTFSHVNGVTTNVFETLEAHSTNSKFPI